MARRLLLLASIAAAGATLAACDNPAAGILSTAEQGQCFAVTGKDSLGQPKLIRADCATPGAVTAPPPAVPAQASTACVKPAAPVILPPPCGVAKANGAGLTYQTAKVRHHTRKPARVVRKAVRHKGSVHYEYVPAGGEVFHSSSSYEYARPSQTTELAGGYSHHREEAYVAPPPPPPPPPAPPAHAYGHGSQQQSRAYESQRSESQRYESRSSSSSSYTSSSQASRRKPCNCSRDRRPVIIEQYERDGYLTWPGKAPY